MKVLFVLRSVANFAYHESTIRHLCGNGHVVEVLYDRVYSSQDSDGAAQACVADLPGLSLGWAMRRRGPWRKPVFGTRELLSYSSYLNRRDQAEFYLKRWERYLPPGSRTLMARSRLARKILASAATQAALRAFEGLVPADTEITRRLRRSRPDVVVASPVNYRYSEEVEYIKAAKALGIPTVVPVFSWDNLTTKGLLHVIPDLTLAWNGTQLEEAVSIHRVPRDRIVVTGSPFLDKWLDDATASLDEAKFRALVGLEPERPFVLYLGSSTNIARDESWLVLKLAKSLQASSDQRLREIAVLVRPHGANQDIFRGISAPNVRVWLRDDPLPDSPQSFAEFAASVRYSVCAVGLNTTGMVDALLGGRPVITLLVEEYRDTNASQAVHFRYVLDADVYLRTHTTDGCAELIAGLLDGSDSNRESRRRFALNFVRPHGLDRPVGELAAKAIEMAAHGKSAVEITEDIASGNLAETPATR